MPYFPTPFPELLLSISLFSLSHLLHPYLFTLAGLLLPHPTATSALGTALHVILRNALRTAAFPMLALAAPSGYATFRAPAFRRVWWLALGWSLAEVTAGIAQEYEALALYRDVLVPEGEARELVAKVVAAAGTAPLKNGGSDGSSPRAADERLRESLSRGEEGGPVVELAGSPVSGRQHQKSQQTSSRSSWMALANDAEIQIEVDKDFDALVAVKARDELEELYGCPVIVSLWNFYLFITVADCQLLYVWMVVRACVRVLRVARRVGITLPRHCAALISRVPHRTSILAANCGIRRDDDDHSALLVQQRFLGHILRRVWCQLGPVDAAHACVFAPRRRARGGVPRILDWVGNVVHGFEHVGCIVVRYEVLWFGRNL